MTAYVSLLRGVNVGGVQLSMPELKALYDDLGLGAVTTYIRSGNVVCTSDDDADAVRDLVETGIEQRFGQRIEVVLRTHEQLAAVVAANPFPRADPAHLHVVFLADPVAGDVTGPLDRTDFGADEYAGRGAEIYLHLPGGFGRSRLATRMSALRRPPATTRNWRTVNKLLDLSAAVS